MIRKTALLSAASSVAFANAAAKSSAAPAAPAADAPAVSASKRRERTDVTVLSVAAPMALPKGVASTRRGKGSKYKFDELAAPVPNPDAPGEFLYHSFGLTGMDKKGFNSTLFSANQRYKKSEPKRGPDGAIVMKQGAEIKDAAGNVVGHAAGTEPELIEIVEREFTSVEVDPKTDPDKASLRVFRIK